MAYSYTGSSRIGNTSCSIAGYPMTLAAWSRPLSGSGTYAIASTQAVNSSAHRHVLFYNLNNACVYSVNGSSGTTVSASTGAGSVSTDTWGHFCAVSSSASSHIAYYNGVGSTASTVNTLSMQTQTSIQAGARYSGTAYTDVAPSGTFICEVAVWSVALTAAEVLSLSRGVSAALVRPQSLYLYCPMTRDLSSPFSGKSFSLTGSPTVAAHPRIYAA